MTVLLADGVCAAADGSREPLTTIPVLRSTAGHTHLDRERTLPDGASYRAYLVTYRVAGLKLHAMVAVPKSPRPPAGYPVLVAGHGTHPKPPRYGFTADGVDSRPGDYYRPVPELYAAAGFLVVMPDYRGHNVSEGAEYAGGMLSAAYYAEDVLALVLGLDQLPEADARNVFLWGHSLGAEVCLRVLLATDRIRAASLWSTIGSDPWERAFGHAASASQGPVGDEAPALPAMQALEAELASLPVPYDADGNDPLRFLGELSTPVILHHAIGDPEVPLASSMRLASQLTRWHKPYVFHRYSAADHFLQSPDRELAVGRDVAFFRARMSDIR